MKNKMTQNLLLGLFILTLGACGSRRNNNLVGYNPAYPGGSTGLACAGLQNTTKLGVYYGDFGNGSSFAIDIYQGNNDKIAAVGDVYIADINRFWDPGLNTPMGQTQQFVSCLTSNGFNGTLTSAGTGAYRNLEVVLQGTNIAITLGSNLPGTSYYTQLAGNNIIGPAYVQTNGVAAIKVLTTTSP